MLEDVVHDSGIIISATRVYTCNNTNLVANGGHVVVTRNGYLKIPRSPRDIPDEAPCYNCEQIPLLWDPHAYAPYTLHPYVITEEEY